MEITNNPISVVYEKTVCPNKHNVEEHDKFCKQCGEKTIKEEQYISKAEYENSTIILK